jgi:hypothetical protein
MICVRARTRDVAVACPDCGAPTARVHGYHERTAADVPAGGRRVLVRVRVRRLRCPVPGCPRQTFREQVRGVLDRYQQRTTRLTGQVRAAARELAGRAGARLLPALGIMASRHTALRVLLRIPHPAATIQVAPAGRVTPEQIICAHPLLRSAQLAGVPSRRSGRSRSGTPVALRYNRWPRLSREIRPICAAAGPRRVMNHAVQIWAICIQSCNPEKRGYVDGHAIPVGRAFCDHVIPSTIT